MHPDLVLRKSCFRSLLDFRGFPTASHAEAMASRYLFPQRRPRWLSLDFGFVPLFPLVAKTLCLNLDTLKRVIFNIFTFHQNTLEISGK